jgi:hypothetical protein
VTRPYKARRSLRSCASAIQSVTALPRCAPCNGILPSGKRFMASRRRVIFEQVHTPGERAQSDFTHMEDLEVTIAGESFPHMVSHARADVLQRGSGQHLLQRDV